MHLETWGNKLWGSVVVSGCDVALVQTFVIGTIPKSPLGLLKGEAKPPMGTFELLLYSDLPICMRFKFLWKERDGGNFEIKLDHLQGVPPTFGLKDVDL